MHIPQAHLPTKPLQHRIASRTDYSIPPLYTPSPSPSPSPSPAFRIPIAPITPMNTAPDPKPLPETPPQPQQPPYYKGRV